MNDIDFPAGVNVEEVMASIRGRMARRRTERLQQLSAGTMGNGRPPSEYLPPEEIAPDQNTLADIEFLNQRWDTCNIPMINHHGSMATTLKRVLNRLIRFNTFWQATVNGAITRVLGSFSLRLQNVYRNLLSLTESTAELHRRVRALESRLAHLEAGRASQKDSARIQTADSAPTDRSPSDT